MPVYRPPLTSVCIVALLTLIACGGEPQSGASLTAPTAVQSTPSAIAMATLRVQVDSICAGRETQIQVFVDRVSIGVTNPGDPGVSKAVTLGDHMLSAISQRGTQWGPFPTTVTVNGDLERLGCMPADGI